MNTDSAGHTTYLNLATPFFRISVSIGVHPWLKIVYGLVRNRLQN
jgi:hypothetical protein